jgi:hypothetical protein
MSAHLLLAVVSLTLGLMTLGVGLEVYLAMRALERITELIQGTH